MEELAADGGDGQATLEALVDPAGTTVLKIAGELDFASIGPIRVAIAPLLGEARDRAVFDLSDLRFMDSSGLALFLTVAQRVAEVELRNLSPIVRKVIDLTGLSSFFTITP